MHLTSSAIAHIVLSLMWLVVPINGPKWKASNKENHGYSLINDIRTTIESCKMLKMTYFGLVCGFGGTLA